MANILCAYTDKVPNPMTLLFVCIALLAIIAAGLFALQTDDKDNSYQVTRGESFYMQVNKINHFSILQVLKLTVLRVLFIN